MIICNSSFITNAFKEEFTMMTEEVALEKFRQLVRDAKERGETGLLIWKSPEERSQWGKTEEEMYVKNAFEVYGYNQDGEAYGTYRNMELVRAIRNAFECDYQFKLTTVDGKAIAAMTFQIDKLLSIEGHLMFACRSMLYKHLSGPIVSIPSYQVIE